MCGGSRAELCSAHQRMGRRSWDSTAAAELDLTGACQTWLGVILNHWSFQSAWSDPRKMLLMFLVYSLHAALVRTISSQGSWFGKAVGKSWSLCSAGVLGVTAASLCPRCGTLSWAGGLRPAFCGCNSVAGVQMLFLEALWSWKV